MKLIGEYEPNKLSDVYATVARRKQYYGELRGRCLSGVPIMRNFLVAGGISVMLFFVVAVLVFTNISQSFDARLALMINHADPGIAFSQAMVLFSKYGREYFWVPVVAIMLILGNRDTKMLAFELGALFVAGIIAGEALKIFLYRPRPFVSLTDIVLRVPTDTDSSFPSGHALIVSIGAVFSIVKFRHKKAAVLLAIEAALVCYSRVFVGAHYPLDVVAGIFLGTGIALIGIFIVERYFSSVLNKLSEISVTIFKNGPLAA